MFNCYSVQKFRGDAVCTPGLPKCGVVIHERAELDDDDTLTLRFNAYPWSGH